MNTYPTKDQVQSEISKLREIMPKVRRYSSFGDDNWECIKAEILVLENNWSEDEIYVRFSSDEEESSLVLDSALDARHWLDGDWNAKEQEADSPAGAWESLVKP